MTNKKNKVKYGIRNVYYALGTEDDNGAITYGDPVKWPGARALSLTAQGEITKWPADDVTYWTGSSNDGYDGDLTMARVIDSFHTDVLGEKADDKGVLVEYADVIGKIFALLFEFEGDQKATRHVLYNCTASRPDLSGNTVDGSITPEEESVHITASPRISDKVVKAKTTVDSDEEAYNSWYTKVYEPTFTNAGN